MRWGLAISLALAVGACTAERDSSDQAKSCALHMMTIGRMISLPGGELVKGFAPVYPEEQPRLRFHVAAVDKIRDGSIANVQYDPTTASLIERAPVP